MAIDQSVISMITPDPEADEARRLGLRRMRTIAVGLLVLAAVVYVATLGQHGWLGFVNAGAEASMVGADGRLVRGDGTVQAPPRPADPPHRADTQAQGRAGPRAPGVRR